MGVTMNLFLPAVTGPKVYRVPVQSYSEESVEYESNPLESLLTALIDTAHSFYGLLKWTVILWGPWFLRNVQSHDHLTSYAKLVCLGCILYLTALCARGIGRLWNPTYVKFISLYRSAALQPSETNLRQLTLYSFSSPWPASFDVRQLPSTVLHRPHINPPQRSTGIPVLLWPVTRLFAHTIGIRMAYPGCTAILNMMTLPARLEARDRLRALHGIQRIGLATREGKFVEGFYTDRRTSSPLPGGSNGNYLIVCCEGNGGYPEIGIPLVPLELGYSVLAWNHPGFGSSTGMPFPKQECNAMEAVLLFAIHHLKFKWNEIYLYGWSIGGYTASWAAMNYPSVGGLILDATFDDLDELARRTVPDCLYPLVLATVKQTLDLNNSAQLIAYNGPVRIIRRSDDEIISTSEPPNRASNRGNVLLIKLLRHRFPNLMAAENEAQLTHYLTLSAEEQALFVEEMNCSPEQHASYILNFLKTEAQRARVATAADDEDTTNPGPYSGLFPSQLGSQISDPTTKFAMLLYLVSRYFTEAPGTHCAPLSSSCFELPWWPCE